MGQLALKQTDALYGADTHAWALEQAAFLRAGRLQAIAETDLNIPEKPPFTIDQALDRAFLPD